MDIRLKHPVGITEIEELTDMQIIRLLRDAATPKATKKLIKEEMLLRLFESVKYITKHTKE